MGYTGTDDHDTAGGLAALGYTWWRTTTRPMWRS